MSTAETRPTQRKGPGTVAKVFWVLLLLLALTVAGFVYSAWQQLNRIEPVTTPQTPATVEVWTPAGANPNAPVYVPQPGHSASAPTTALPPKTASAPLNPPSTTPRPVATAPTAPQETPVLPVTPPATPKPVAKKPAANDPLDNLF